MNEYILTTNLCGRNIYIKNHRGKKLLFGTVISDWTFDPQDIRDRYTGGCAGQILLDISKNQNVAGWTVANNKEKYIFEKKRISVNSNTKGWYLDKELIKNGEYFLDEKMAMVMTNE